MRIVGLALAGMFAIIVPIVGHADGPKLNLRPADQRTASNIVPIWEGGRSGGHSGAIGGRTAAAEWSNGTGDLIGGQTAVLSAGSISLQGVPTYWIWVPGSAVFDYPFVDRRGPTGGRGNP
jgi:hypothetical protein